jgi:signal transduction histidine kinase/DNA-binding NarL/FixJ family response regulator
MTDPDAVDLRTLVCAPIGRDTALTVSLLERAGLPCLPCQSVGEVCDCFLEGAGAILLTEEALGDPRLDELAELLAAQPAWSDISILLFAGGRRDEASLRTLRKLEILRNVTLLDRPVRTSAVISTVRAALRGRRRQYQLRDVLVALHKARADAEEANRLKDEFLATVSHELRTPLNAIMGWVSLLRQARFDRERVAGVLEIVERNAKAQAQIIADVLDISRMITGRMKLNQAPVSLARAVLDALDAIRPGVLAKGIEVRTDIDEGAIVYGDAERLQQVFWNIFANACKFTPAGGRIDVTLQDGGLWSTVRVTDSGAGISPEFLPCVFDRFRQADQSFTRAHGGLGLGLAIVKHLVEMHGGEVTARSEGVGKGATFEVRLPAGAESRPAPEGHHAPRAADPVPAFDLGGRLVLMVDDHEATRDLMRTILTECGARVIAVANAAEALAQFELEAPAAVLADIGMPGEDGLSMIRRIRARPPERGGAVPAVALSAYVRTEDRQAALAAGYDDFVAKPAMPADVVRAIAAVLENGPTESGYNTPRKQSRSRPESPEGGAAACHTRSGRS